MLRRYRIKRRVAAQCAEAAAACTALRNALSHVADEPLREKLRERLHFRAAMVLEVAIPQAWGGNDETVNARLADANEQVDQALADVTDSFTRMSLSVAAQKQVRQLEAAGAMFGYAAEQNIGGAKLNPIVEDLEEATKLQ